MGGCTENERRLTFWVGGAPQEVDYWETLVSEFEASSGIDVEVIRQPAATDQRKQGLVIALASRRPDPDVFLMDIIWLTQFVRSDWLEPLDDYFRSSSLHPRLFFASVVDTVDRHDDRYYALPAFLDVGVLYYRKDLLQRHGFQGPPVTWDALVKQALEVQRAERRSNPGFNGFVWQGAQYEGLVCTFLEFVATHGGGILTDGRIDLTRDANVQALQFMRDLIRRWHISPPNTYTEMQEEEVRRSFQRGNALFERNWLYAWNLHQRPASAVKNKIGMTALPHSPGAATAATLGGWHLGISKYSDTKDRAWQLATFLLSQDTQKKLLMNLGWYSGRKDVYTDPEVRRNVANVDQLQQIVEQAVSRPDLAYYDHVSRILQRYVNDCLSGKTEVRPAFSAMQQEIDRIEAVYGTP
jgi:multiple sugar transport system substrate-binding protein